LILFQKAAVLRSFRPFGPLPMQARDLGDGHRGAR
jgi:hypothetical protein